MTIFFCYFLLRHSVCGNRWIIRSIFLPLQLASLTCKGHLTTKHPCIQYRSRLSLYPPSGCDESESSSDLAQRSDTHLTGLSTGHDIKLPSGLVTILNDAVVPDAFNEQGAERVNERPTKKPARLAVPRRATEHQERGLHRPHT
jgi:hypothetical protein